VATPKKLLGISFPAGILKRRWGPSHHGVRLRPPVIQVDPLTCVPVKKRDDRWLVGMVRDAGIPIENTITSHGITLPFDHVHSWMADAKNPGDSFLMLTVQLFMQGTKIIPEPLSSDQMKGALAQKQIERASGS
jgi:hypothetical protein